MRIRVLVLALAATACNTREPATPALEAKPAPTRPSTTPSPADPAASTAETLTDSDGSVLVSVELGRIEDAALEAAATRLGPDSPLADAEALVSVHYAIAKDWHIYWQNPGDSGLRTKIEAKAKGATPGPALYPAPERLVAKGGQVSYGWGEAAVLFVPLRALAEDASIEIHSDYLACRESCIRGEAAFEVSLASLRTRTDATTSAMLARLPEPAAERIETSWSEGRLLVRGTPGVGLDELFPHASNTVFLETQAIEDGALHLDYRFTATPSEPGQGVLRTTIEGRPRWLELAVPWPTPTPS